jgi:ComF family protein
MGVLESIIGWIAPPICLLCGSEGTSLCLSCAANNIIPYGERCFNCSALSPLGRTCQKCRHLNAPRSVWVATDYQGASKTLIQAYKFNHQREAVRPVASLMVETFLNFNSDQGIRETKYLIVPVPTATSRVRERGFDHSALLARHIARKLGLRYSHAMKRLGQSRQVGKTRAERLRQVEDKYVTKNAQEIRGRNILLIDDVVTTGATLTAAAQALRKAGARRVDALVFAKRL